MQRHQDTLIAGGLMLALLYAIYAIWFGFMPNEAGRVSADFSLWLPDMLAGYYWYVQNGLLAVPWFSPSQCAGIPFHADPQLAWFSVPQFLTIIMPPLQAAKLTFLLFAAAGFWGAWHLARRTFVLSLPASLFTAALFMLNGFFSVRMVVGHLTYAPFMLLPALAACMLRPPGAAPCAWPDNILRSTLGGLIVALSLQAGMVHILPPEYLALVMVLLIHAMRFGTQPAALGRLAAATAIGLALTGVAIQTVALGRLPLISLVLATTFWIYGLIRRQIAVDAQAGLFVETACIAVPGLAYVIWLGHTGGALFGHAWGTSLLLSAVGPMTVAPLALFSWTARRLPFAILGFLQYISPTVGFAIGVIVGEPLTALRMVSFGFIWVGVLVFAFGAWRAARRNQRAS